MKLRYFAILAAVFFCAACNQAKPYQIEGIYNAENGTEVYLIDLNGPDGGDTLSVTTVQGGKFAFTGKVEKPFYAYVGNAKRRVRMILEPGNAAVDLNEWTIAGTPMMDAVGAYNDTFYGFDHIRADKREDTETALAKLDMPWNQILDAQKIPAEIYGVNAIPHLILFAPDGTILRRDLRGEQIFSALEEILK